MAVSDQLPVPERLTAATRTWYAVPLVKPVKSVEVPVVLRVSTVQLVSVPHPVEQRPTL